MTDVAHLEGAAEHALRAAGMDSSGAVSVVELASCLLGDPAPILRVGPSALPRNAKAAIGRHSGRTRMYVLRGLDQVEERFAIGHELGHRICDHPQEMRTIELEREANYVAACIVVPRAALRAARRDLGDDLAGLAEAFLATQTAVALRLGEAGALPAVIVVAPAIVRVRSLSEIVVPPEEMLRRAASASARELRRTLGPGVRRARLTDDRKRVALLLEEEQVA